MWIQSYGLLVDFNKMQLYKSEASIRLPQYTKQCKYALELVTFDRYQAINTIDLNQALIIYTTEKCLL